MSNHRTMALKIRVAKRSFFILLAFFLFAAYLLVNVFSLSVLNHDYYNQKAYDQLTTVSALRAERGNIYDANMNLLATTKTTWRVFVFPREISQRTKDDGTDYASIISKGLAEILNINEKELHEK